MVDRGVTSRRRRASGRGRAQPVYASVHDHSMDSESESKSKCGPCPSYQPRAINDVEKDLPWREMRHSGLRL